MKVDKKNLLNKIKRFAKFMYLKIFRTNDSPFRISLGFGLGVFTAVMPAIGPFAALALAFLFRANRATAFLGSMLFNTWFGLIILIPVIKVGSIVMGLNYSDVYNAWISCLKGFSLVKLSKLSIHEVIIPILVGYLLVALLLGIVSFIIAYIITRKRKNIKLRRNS